MSIDFQILGHPGFDNCLYLRVDTGASVEKLLFDCGEDCLDKISISQLKGIDYIFFSHFHMDHIAGFDYYFRRVYHRSEPVHIYVPGGTVDVIHNRFRGLTWNLEQPKCTWFVTECCEKILKTYRFEKHELFEHKHFVDEHEYDRTILDLPTFSIDAVIMNHKTPTLSFCVREKTLHKVDEKKLRKMNLSPGGWLQSLKNLEIPDSDNIFIDKTKHNVGKLRKRLFREKSGDSIAYLTDFRLDTKTSENLQKMIQRCKTIVCESMYDNADIELAERNYHLIARESAEIAKNTSAKKLYLMHISERYSPQEMLEILEQAREIFPQTFLPKGWREKLMRKSKKSDAS